jgi:hypothetical protein
LDNILLHNYTFSILANIVLALAKYRDAANDVKLGLKTKEEASEKSNIFKGKEKVSNFLQTSPTAFSSKLMGLLVGFGPYYLPLFSLLLSLTIRISDCQKRGRSAIDARMIRICTELEHTPIAEITTVAVVPKNLPFLKMNSLTTALGLV